MQIERRGKVIAIGRGGRHDVLPGNTVSINHFDWLDGVHITSSDTSLTIVNNEDLLGILAS